MVVCALAGFSALLAVCMLAVCVRVLSVVKQQQNELHETVDALTREVHVLRATPSVRYVPVRYVYP